MPRVKCLHDELSIQEYNKVEKICKMCGKTYFEAWTKSGYSDFCSQKCSKSFATKMNRREINEKISKSLISNHNSVNLSIKNDYDKNPKICSICKKIIPYERRKRNTCCDKCAKIMAVQTRKNNPSPNYGGGYREGSGRSKSGYYNNIFMGSTYELVYYIYQTDHGVSVERNKCKFEYEYEGKKYTYLPDFVVDGKYIEIKGYHTPIVDIKVQAVKNAGKTINVVYFEDLEPMMTYVDKKFGLKHNGKSNTYYVLYQNYKPKYEYVCSHCGKKFTSNKKRSTKRVFCSQKCLSKSPTKANKDYIDFDQIKNICVEIPNFKGFWLSKNDEIFSNHLNLSNNKVLRLKPIIRKNNIFYKLNRKQYKLSDIKKQINN